MQGWASLSVCSTERIVICSGFASQLAAFVCFHAKCLPLFYTKPSTQYNSCSFPRVLLSLQHLLTVSPYPSLMQLCFNHLVLSVVFCVCLSIFIHLVNNRDTGIVFFPSESSHFVGEQVNESSPRAISLIHNSPSSRKPLFILSSAVKSTWVWEMEIVTLVIFVSCLSSRTHSHSAYSLLPLA